MYAVAAARGSRISKSDRRILEAVQNVALRSIQPYHTFYYWNSNNKKKTIKKATKIVSNKNTRSPYPHIETLGKPDPEDLECHMRAIYSYFYYNKLPLQNPFRIPHVERKRHKSETSKETTGRSTIVVAKIVTRSEIECTQKYRRTVWCSNVWAKCLYLHVYCAHLTKRWI